MTRSVVAEFDTRAVLSGAGNSPVEFGACRAGDLAAGSISAAVHTARTTAAVLQRCGYRAPGCAFAGRWQPVLTSNTVLAAVPNRYFAP